MTCIVCVSANWGIGKDNNLLFRLPPDMAFFKKTTIDQTVIMGHNTLRSMPGGRPLPRRTNIVLSRHLETAPENTLLCRSTEELFQLMQDQPKASYFLIGGEVIYRELLPYCRRALITKVQQSPPADCFFPNLDENPNWKLAEASDLQHYEDLAFTFCRYENVNPLPMQP